MNGNENCQFSRVTSEALCEYRHAAEWSQMATQGQPYDCIDFCREQYVLGNVAKVHMYMLTLESRRLVLLPEGSLRREEIKQVSHFRKVPPLL